MGKKMVRIMHIRGKPSQAKRSVSAKELSLTHQNDIKAILAGVKWAGIWEEGDDIIAVPDSDHERTYKKWYILGNC